MSDRALRLLASGFYGGYNMGDEAVLSGLLALLGSASPPVDLTVLSGNPDFTHATYGIRALDRSIFRDAVPRALALRQSDALVLGGGGLLQDITGRRGIRGTLGRTLSLARWANRYGIPLVFWAVGVGPLHYTSVPQVAEVLRHATALTVRDKASQALLRLAGVDAEILPDLAWALDLPQRTGGQQLGISLRRWPGLDLPAVAHGLRSVHGWFPGPIVFLPFERQDLEVGQALQDLMGHDQVDVPPVLPNLPEIIERYALCGAVIAMRLHSGLLATAQGIPSVGLAYDTKVSELHDALGSNGLWLPVTRAGDAPGALLAALGQHSGWGGQLRSYAAEQRRLAFAGAERILALLQSGARRDRDPVGPANGPTGVKTDV
jgi:polysaccharide pyruvyl transferase CsaB